MSDTLEIITRRAPLATATWDPETRTAEAVLATGTPVERFDTRGAFDEVLSIEGVDHPGEVPLLDSHQRGSLAHRIGTVDRIHIEGGELRGRVRLSRSSEAAQRIAEDLSDGHRFGVSVGYVVRTWKDRTNPESRRREKVAASWELLEASLVAVPADRNSGLRSVEMEETITGRGPETEDTRADTTALSRAEINATIRSIAEIAGLDQAWIDAQIDNEADVETARAAAFDEMQRRRQTVRTTRATVGTDYTDPEWRARTIGEALYTRVTPDHTPSEPARGYVGHTILDIARDCLRTASVQTTGLSPMRTIERALHSTSDFPLILGEAVNKTLRSSYQAVPSGLKRVARRTTARDFREKHRIALSEAPRLETVNEGGEFKHGTLAEAQETYKVTTFGRIIGVTRQTLVNDDVGAFTDLARRLGQAAMATEAALLVDLLEENSGFGPAMSDGIALFDSDHGNIEEAAENLGAPAVDTLSAARTAMRSQVGLSGELVAVTPRYLVVPPALETTAEQVLTGLTPTQTTDVNPFSGALALVVEPRLTSAARWYVVADPSEVDGLEYAYLEGEEGPQIDTRAGFDVDGVQIKVRLDVGCGFVDYRGWFANPGE